MLCLGFERMMIGADGSIKLWWPPRPATFYFVIKIICVLMVREWDSCSDGRGFISQHRILDGHFSTLICYKNCFDVCLKKTETKRKRSRGWPIFLKKYSEFCLGKGKKWFEYQVCNSREVKMSRIFKMFCKSWRN